MNTSATEDAPPTGTVRFEVNPQNGYYAPGDSRGRDEEFELQDALKAQLAGNLKTGAAEGDKGVITDVVLPLATGGAFTAMVDAFKAWLSSRPQHRTIELEFEIDEQDGKRSGTLTVDAKNVDSIDLDTIVREAFQTRA
jgi:hypothetical protein